jgi:hypothetical protein
LASGKVYHFKLDANRTHLVLPQSLSSQLSISNLIDARDSLKPDPITFADGFGAISDVTIEIFFDGLNAGNQKACSGHPEG